MRAYHVSIPETREGHGFIVDSVAGLEPELESANAGDRFIITVMDIPVEAFADLPRTFDGW